MVVDQLGRYARLGDSTLLFRFVYCVVDRMVGYFNLASDFNT
jgi:hypothetical protein